MSLATDFLTDYLGRTATTQADFSRAAGMTQTNLSDILSGQVEVSGRNLSKLLRGLREEHERAEFLAAYLRDQIPDDMSDEVTVHHKVANPHAVADEQSDTELEVALVQGFNALPNDSYRRRVVRFLIQLRKDADLRDLFRRTMEYVDDDISQQKLARDETAGLQADEQAAAKKVKR